ncbi:unnamed protein product [Didymodactylos carnosus]|uniref:Uncharacterized protein n=1 Tax=Didymodactylos carnosus TaxID=1234261 RepID=A0A814FBR6_9BILA|nr:unnamed protein product [Didymodactylos carnosus]CAF0983662.1 unnamed protein product [Didymodactylos carnosus]CAF3562562.1 unnamed protein product [Didymodactylos carnosus]CAF3756032.1 unnamed protein product [Didymodactylos carnosus]
MQQKIFFLAVLAGVCACGFGLDLAHVQTAQQQFEAEARGLISDFYGTVLYKPLNHLVTTLSLLGAQLLAGIAEQGIPAPNGRTVQMTEAQLRGFWNDLLVGILKPIEQAVQKQKVCQHYFIANINLLATYDVKIVEQAINALNTIDVTFLTQRIKLPYKQKSVIKFSSEMVEEFRKLQLYEFDEKCLMYLPEKYDYYLEKCIGYCY